MAQLDASMAALPQVANFSPVQASLPYCAIAMTKPDPIPHDRDAPSDVDADPEPSLLASATHDRRLATARDREWVARIREGDATAFESLFLEYTPRLCDFVFRYVHSREEAQEVVQELFVWLWQRREELDIQGPVASYLYTAARHQSINRLRREQVRERWRRGVVALSERETQAVGADAALELAERQAAIERAIAELPARRRAVCVLRWVEGLSYAAIAQRLGVSEKTVDGQLQRAIQHVRRALIGF